MGIDARDGKVAVHGWTETSDATAAALAQRMERLGVCRIIYTDISRDGTQQGVNIAATRGLAEAIGIPVTASGGVGSIADIEALTHCESAGIDAVIVGRALYTGALRLPEAIAAARRADR